MATRGRAKSGVRRTKSCPWQDEIDSEGVDEITADPVVVMKNGSPPGCGIS